MLPIDYVALDIFLLNGGIQNPKQESVLELGCGFGNPVTAALASIQRPANETSIGGPTPRFSVWEWYLVSHAGIGDAGSLHECRAERGRYDGIGL
ncbi:hypothetical protein BDW66DRAFT_131646 [Aspergillus desertorum]